MTTPADRPDEPWLDYSPTENALEGRIVLVTGATSGIGRAVASALASSGATVVLHGRSPDKLEALYAEISAAGGEAACAALDLEHAQGPAYQALVDSLEERFGRLDGLLHNAAILGDRSPIEHYDIGVWQRVLHVNLTAPFILTRCLLPLLRESASPAIVFTTSTVGHEAKAYWGAYSVSKFGLEGLARMLAAELRQTPVRVNCVNPGATRTAMRRRAYPAEDPELLPMPETLVAPFLYLLGPEGRETHGRYIECQPAQGSAR